MVFLLWVLTDACATYSVFDFLASADHFSFCQNGADVGVSVVQRRVVLPEVGDEVEMVVEVPRFSPIKRRPNGTIHFISPLPSPFNYGSVIGRELSADGDPLDALLLGSRVARGTKHVGTVLGIVDFVDAGIEDPKLVVGRPPLAHRARREVERFFTVYAWAKSVFGGGGEFRGWR